MSLYWLLQNKLIIQGSLNDYSTLILRNMLQRICFICKYCRENKHWQSKSIGVNTWIAVKCIFVKANIFEKSTKNTAEKFPTTSYIKLQEKSLKLLLLGAIFHAIFIIVLFILVPLVAKIGLAPQNILPWTTQ